MSMPYVSLNRSKRGIQIMKEEIPGTRKSYRFEDMNGVSEDSEVQRSYTDMTGMSRKNEKHYGFSKMNESVYADSVDNGYDYSDMNGLSSDSNNRSV